jgi:hypothetical protein
MAYELSRLMDELAHNYKVDTGRLIGEDLWPFKTNIVLIYTYAPNKA